VDLTEPTPELGWANSERASLESRGPADAVLALALIHHLCISHNIRLDMLADWLASLGKVLIVEWVPKADPQVQRLLRSREDIFDEYTLSGFERAFRQYFAITARYPIPGTDRNLFAMKLKAGGGAVLDAAQRDKAVP